MTENSPEHSLALTLRHTFGEILDIPLFAPERAASGGGSAEALSRYAEKIRYCESCSLHIGRRNLVFGRGHWEARIAFVGDYPSQTDDEKGEPFSGESGALLHKMIVAMKLKPEETYLTNIFKCRPPAGEQPGSAHFLACEPHLRFQFEHVQAKLIVAMGGETARALSRSEAPIQVLRKQIFDWQGIKVICTHHPRDLQLQPLLKKEAWDDLQAAMRLLS
jgi:DNA polymerase